MATLHQVHRRSGNSAVGAVAADLGVDVSLMGGILAKGRKFVNARAARNFGDKYLQCFKR